MIVPGGLFMATRAGCGGPDTPNAPTKITHPRSSSQHPLGGRRPASGLDRVLYGIWDVLAGSTGLAGFLLSLPRL